MSLLAFWSPKGGSGTSVIAAACALHAAQTTGSVRLVDLCGDQPAILGLGADPETGVADWLAAGPTAPTDALDRLTDRAQACDESVEAVLAALDEMIR